MVSHAAFKNRLTLLLIAFIVAVVGFTLLAGYTGIPSEDAAILYSYSRNLADTGVISYYPGGGRVEGATDFGWMISIAFLQKLGIPNHVSSSLLNALVTALFGYRLLTIQKRLVPRVEIINLLISLSAFLGLVYASGIAISGLGGFSTIAQICLLATIFTSCFFGSYDGLFLGASIYYVLLRPDSIAYYLVIIFSYFLVDFGVNKFQCFSGSGRKPALERMIATLMPALVFAVYWLGRWFYFQKPFPLPYYVKQSKEFGLDTMALRFLRELFLNGYNNLALSIVILLALVICVMSQSFFERSSMERSEFVRHCQGESIAENSCLVLTPDLWASGLVVFLMFYVYQSLYLSRFNLIQNVWDRFHAPLLSLSGALLSIFLLVYSNRLPVRGRKSIASLLMLGSLVLVMVHSTANFRSIASGYKGYFLAPHENNIYPLSKDLSTIRDGQKAPLMFVTEAGRLSYYSRIPTIDTWGLNTPEYSVNPLQDPSEVARIMPDIINMHVDFSRLSLTMSSKHELAVGRSCEKSGESSDNGYCGWHQMNQAIFDGAMKLGYEPYLVPFVKGADARQRHDLYMVSPSSIFAESLRKTLTKNNGIKIYDLSELKKYRW